MDVSYLMNVQQPRIDNPLDTMARGLSVKQLMRQNQLDEKQDADTNLLNKLLSKNTTVGPDGKPVVNRKGLLNELMQVNPQKAIEWDQVFKDRDLKEMEQNSKIAKSLWEQITPENYSQIRAKAIELGLPNVDKMPEVYVDSFVHKLRSATEAGAKELETRIKEAQLAKTEAETRKLRSEGGEGGGKIPQNVYAAATYGKRLEDANAQIEKLIQGGYDPTSKRQALGNYMTPEAFLPENPKLMDQAQRNFVNAVLRRESGAAIAESEFASARKQYFPQPGDTSAVLEQKKRNREVALAGLKAEGAKAWHQVEKNLPPKESSQPHPKVGEVVDGYSFLGGDPSDPKSWKAVK